VNAKYDILGGKIAQGQGGIETDDEARDEVLEERSGPVVLRAVGGKPFVVVLAKALQEGEYGRELRHEIDYGFLALDNFHFMGNDGVQECIASSKRQPVHHLDLGG
jgi:hypothetical protein